MNTFGIKKRLLHSHVGVETLSTINKKVMKTIFKRFSANNCLRRQPRSLFLFRYPLLATHRILP